MSRVFALCTVALLAACSGKSNTHRGGNVASGGAGATTETGGSPANGGAPATGGAAGTAGAATGGAGTTGGAGGGGAGDGGGADAGAGGSGEAGAGGASDESVVVSLPCAMSPLGVVKCWGGNSSGVLGAGDEEDRGDESGEMGSSLPAVDLGSGLHAHSLASRHGSCAIVDGDLLKCWGLGAYGQLGQGDQENRGDGPGEMGDALPFVDLGSGARVASVVRRDHACALLATGRVKCWGSNRSGQLGQGDRDDRGDDPGEMGDDLHAVDLGTDATASAVTIGGDHSCAWLGGASVKCWGSNAMGQLGSGEPGNLGDEPNEMGDRLPAVDFGSGRHATSIAAGDYHTCAILDDHSLKCWGDNEKGQLGLGDRNARGDDPDEMGDHLPAVALGRGRHAIAVAAGLLHTCAILDNDTLKCWGSNQSGQLGVGDADDHGDDPDEMGDALPVVDLGTGARVVGISLLDDITCATLAGGAVKCWGWNAQGNLGLGDTMWRGYDSADMGNALPALDLGF